MASIDDRWAGAKTGAGRRWRGRYRTPDGQSRSKSFDRRDAAKAFEISVESALQTQTFVDPVRSALTFGELAERWTASKVNVKASTRATYAAVMDDHVLPRWRMTRVSAIDYEDVQSWVAELAGRHSAAHVRKIYSVFSGVLEVAVRSKRLQRNPAQGVEVPTATAKPKRYLTVLEVEALAAAAAQLPPGRPRRTTDAAFEQYRLVILVLAYCGLRWSEMAALRVGAIDLLARRITVTAAVVEVDGAGLVWGTPKNGKPRTIRLPPFLVDDLRGHLADRDRDDLAFTAPDGGVLRNRNARRAWFNRAAAEAGAEGLTPHELRHTAASLAVSAGANVKAVQRMLGHASAAMTLDRYSDLFDDDLEAVADRLDRLRANALPSPVALVPTGEAS